MEFFRHKFTSPIPWKDFVVTDYLSDHHDQDCCENVYVDFEHIDVYREQIDGLGQITEISLSGVENEWIVLFLYDGTIGFNNEPNRLGLFIACRNSQNGYYSSNLELKVKISDTESHTFDLQAMDFIKDEVY